MSIAHVRINSMCNIQKIWIHRRNACLDTPQAKEMQAGVIIHDMNEIRYTFMNLEVGGIIVNDFPTFRVVHMP